MSNDVQTDTSTKHNKQTTHLNKTKQQNKHTYKKTHTHTRTHTHTHKQTIRIDIKNTNSGSEIRSTMKRNNTRT